MKSLLFFMPDLNGGGAEKALIELLKLIDYTKYKVDLFLEFKSGPYISEVPKQVNVMHIYGTRKFYHRVCRKLLKLLHLNNTYHRLFTKRRIRKIVKPRYDAIISFLEGKALKNHISVIERTNNNITWVHCDLQNMHWTLKEYAIKEAEEYSFYKEMNQIVFVSENAQIALNNIYKLDKSKQIVIHNPINREEIITLANSQTIPKRKFTLCTVGRLTQAKGYDRLLRVTKRLVDEGYDFDVWILGDGELKCELTSLSKELGVETFVQFLGFIRPPYPLIKAADAFISTSTAEGFSLVIGEALCLGKVVISTKTAGAIELLQNGKYGILVDHDDYSIYNAIKTIIKNPNLLNEYEEKSLARGSEISNKNEFIQKFYSLFDK